MKVEEGRPQRMSDESLCGVIGFSKMMLQLMQGLIYDSEIYDSELCHTYSACRQLQSSRAQ